MIKAVFDTNILVSALLTYTSGGVSVELLRFASLGRFLLLLSEDILAETAGTLRTSARLRRQYAYTDDMVARHIRAIRGLAEIVPAPPPLGRIVRDPDDDLIIACAVAGGADYLVSRDQDILTLGAYEDIQMVSPERFLNVLRRDG
jgi:uncharacterized protein